MKDKNIGIEVPISYAVELERISCTPTHTKYFTLQLNKNRTGISVIPSYISLVAIPTLFHQTC